MTILLGVISFLLGAWTGFGLAVFVLEGSQLRETFRLLQEAKAHGVEVMELLNETRELNRKARGLMSMAEHVAREVGVKTEIALQELGK